jgi:hypothetical protein
VERARFGRVIFTVALELTGGAALTRDLAIAFGRPWLHLSKTHVGDAATKLREFVQQHKIKVLNIAGPRLATELAAWAFVSQILDAVYCSTRRS